MAQDQRPHQVVHVRENSEEAMEQLFRVLNNRDNQSAMRDRNLPPSFFIPPQRPYPNHSRENSQDCIDTSHFPQSQLQPNHARSHSSPAQFLSPQSLSVPNVNVRHQKQQSVDILDDPGWGADRHTFQQFSQQQQQPQTIQQPQWNITSPNKPAAAHITASAGTQPNPAPQAMCSPASAVPQCNALMDGMLLPLPHGWEISITPDDEIYFINHMNKSTSWFHPSIPKQQQGPGPIRLSQLASPHREMVHQRIAQSQAALQQHHQLPPVSCMPANHSAAPMMAPQQPVRMVPQQPVAGEAVRMVPQQPVSGEAVRMVPQQPVSGEAYIRAQLQALQMQKEKLHQAQEEIARKEHVLKDLIVPAEQMPVNAMQVQSTGVDPFLGQGQNSDSHARQNSTDSGLGGMGNNYSLPRTPEDLLSNVDEMDSTSAEGSRQQSKAQQGSDFNMNDMAGMSMDMAPTAVEPMDGQITAMDGADDLIPSLQPDVLNGDLLQDMDPNSMLTWL